MKRLCLLLFSLLVCEAGDPARAAEPPNVLIILADDLGYSDLGCYGGEIETPHLDRLASNGLRFTQFYNTARCWPSRAALMAGYYAQQVRRDVLPGIESGGGNRGQRPAWAPLLPELLRHAGYRSYHSGKWHIDGMPLAEGFDHSYYLRDQGRFFSPRVHWEDDVKLPPVKRDSGYYGTIAVVDHAIRCLRQHAEQSPEKPFLSYVAFAAPHFPLHALPEDVARYEGRYDAGWERIRQDRYARQQEMGLVDAPLSPVERNVGPPYHFPEHLKILGPNEVNRPLPWEELTEAQQRFQATKMSLHAAMIDRMDREIGRLLDQLRAINAFESTLILFLSDNGASAEIMVRDDGHDPQAPPGSADTYLCLGPGWSTSSNTPFRRHKTWVHEGGISTPLIAHWPRGIAAKGELRQTPGHIVDIVPTVLELAQVKIPAVVAGTEVPPAPGRSLASAFTDDAQIERESLWWLHEGNRAVRVGDWKLVAAKGEPWELYDLSTDRTETRDLAGLQPERVRELEQVWQQIYNESIQLATRDLPPAEAQ
jgi:arylsulfatase A-like enzyme